MRGTWRGPSLLGTPKDMLSKALEMGVSFHRVPVLGGNGGAPFLGPLRKEKNLFIYENF